MRTMIAPMGMTSGMGTQLSSMAGMTRRLELPECRSFLHFGTCPFILLLTVSLSVLFRQFAYLVPSLVCGGVGSVVVSVVLALMHV